MSNTFPRKPLAVVLGAAFALTGMAAQASVFQTADLGAGYMVADAGEAKCGEGKKSAEGKCGEGKCGEGKVMSMMDADKDGKVTLAEHQAHSAEMFKKADTNSDGSVTAEEMKAAMAKMHDGKCGEGKCGEKK